MRWENASVRSFFANFALKECDDRKKAGFSPEPFTDAPECILTLSAATLPFLAERPFLLTIFRSSPAAEKYPHVSLPDENCFWSLS